MFRSAINEKKKIERKTNVEQMLFFMSQVFFFPIKKKVPMSQSISNIAT